VSHRGRWNPDDDELEEALKNAIKEEGDAIPVKPALGEIRSRIARGEKPGKVKKPKKIRRYIPRHKKGKNSK
jgi:hypothetical protein